METLELITTHETTATLVISNDLPKNVHLIPARAELAELEKPLSKFSDRTGTGIETHARVTAAWSNKS